MNKIPLQSMLQHGVVSFQSSSSQHVLTIDDSNVNLFKALVEQLKVANPAGVEHLNARMVCLANALFIIARATSDAEKQQLAATVCEEYEIAEEKFADIFAHFRENGESAGWRLTGVDDCIGTSTNRWQPTPKPRHTHSASSCEFTGANVVLVDGESVALQGFDFRPLSPARRVKSDLRSACLRILGIQLVTFGTGLGKFNLYGYDMFTADEWCIGYISREIVEQHIVKGCVYIFHDLYCPENKTGQKKNYVYTSRFGPGSSISDTSDSLAVCSQLVASTGKLLKDLSWSEVLMPFNQLQYLSLEATKGILLINPSFKSLSKTQMNVCIVCRGQYEASSSDANSETTCCPFDYGFGFVCGKSLNSDGICEKGHQESERQTLAHQVKRTLKIGKESRVTVTLADGELFLGTDRVESDVFIQLHAKLASKDSVSHKVTAVKAALRIANILLDGCFFDLKLMKTPQGWRYLCMRKVERLGNGQLAPLSDIAPNFYLKRHGNMRAEISAIGAISNGVRRGRSARF